MRPSRRGDDRKNENQRKSNQVGHTAFPTLNGDFGLALWILSRPRTQEEAQHAEQHEEMIEAFLMNICVGHKV